MTVALALLYSTWSVADQSPPPAEPSVDTRYLQLETLARGLYYLETMYVDPDKVKPAEMTTNALRGVIEKLDPHTTLMPKEAFKQFTIATEGKFGGIGIVVSEVAGKLVVVSPLDDSPAFAAGIKADDEIVAVDGRDLRKTKNTDQTEFMRGEPGSKVELTIRRAGTKGLMHFSLIREIIKEKSVHWETLASGVHYAHIASFQENTGDELSDALKKHQGDLHGLILDLRDNPGGLVDQAVRVCDLFLDSGVIVSTIGRDRAHVEREYATKRGTYLGFPIVLLVNGGSASASEIVAGALQDHERALVMGTTTFGKGSVQTAMMLPDGSGLKLTIARYYTPKDRSIQAKGITPDIMVPYKPRPSEARGSSGRSEARTEADLAGHITSDDLSDLSKGNGTSLEISKWPEPVRNDNQIVTAFTYLKSWSRFAHPAAAGGGGKKDDAD